MIYKIYSYIFSKHSNSCPLIWMKNIAEKHPLQSSLITLLVLTVMQHPCTKVHSSRSMILNLFMFLLCREVWSSLYVVCYLLHLHLSYDIVWYSSLFGLFTKTTRLFFTSGCRFWLRPMIVHFSWEEYDTILLWIIFDETILKKMCSDSIAECRWYQVWTVIYLTFILVPEAWSGDFIDCSDWESNSTREPFPSSSMFGRFDE